MKGLYMLVSYPQGSYEEAVNSFKSKGVHPAGADNLSIAYQHIFWELESPKEFLEKSPEDKGKKIIAIEIPAGHEIPGHPIRVKDNDTGLIQTLSRGLEYEDVLNVNGCTFHNLQKIKF